MSFTDKLGVIGGTLGVCIGTSLLSFAEVMLFIYIVIKSLYQDARQLWKKIKSLLRFSDPDIEGLVKVLISKDDHISVLQSKLIGIEEDYQENHDVVKLLVSIINHLKFHDFTLTFNNLPFSNTTFQI